MQLHTRTAFAATTVALAFVVALASTALAQSNPHIGSWKGNVAKSTVSAGPTPTSNTTSIVAAGAGTTSTVDSTYTDGTSRHWSYTTNYDGKDSPITGNSQWGDSVAVTRVDANTLRSVYKLKGTVTATQTTVVAPGGKTRTVTTTGKNAAGQTVNNVTVYDKQ